MTFLRISQFLTWPIAFVYFHLFYRLRVNGRENFKNVSSPFIIIVNHFSFVDSFLFRLILGFATPHLPLRFMAVEKFSWRWLNFLSDIGVIPFIYSIFGVFVVVPGLGLHKNLEKARKIIGKKGNIVIYPEGKIVKDNVIAPFKSGAAVLAIETNTPVVPVSLRLGRRKWVRKELVVNVGEAMLVSNGSNIDETVASFYRCILTLYNRS
ncbi:MAG: lysophospholipid acyltransferase family protein [Candidatus Taylorbacteria bacterium]